MGTNSTWRQFNYPHHGERRRHTIRVKAVRNAPSLWLKCSIDIYPQREHIPWVSRWMCDADTDTNELPSLLACCLASTCTTSSFPAKTQLWVLGFSPNKMNYLRHLSCCVMAILGCAVSSGNGRRASFDKDALLQRQRCPRLTATAKKERAKKADACPWPWPWLRQTGQSLHLTLGVTTGSSRQTGCWFYFSGYRLLWCQSRVYFQDNVNMKLLSNINYV